MNKVRSSYLETLLSTRLFSWVKIPKVVTPFLEQVHSLTMTNITDSDFENMMARYHRAHAPLPEEPKSVAATAVKLPSFWIEDPELWFAQIECVFNNRIPKITQDGTKYNYVCEVLPSRVISKVRHIILSAAPEAEKYGLLKTQLMKSFGQKTVTKQAELLQMVSNPCLLYTSPSPRD